MQAILVGVGADAEFANNALEGARDHAKRLGFKIVYDKSYPPNQVDFLPVARAIAATKPDLVFVSSYVADTNGMVRAAAEIKLRCMMFGGAMVGLQVAALKQGLSGVINGVVNYELYLPEPTMQFEGTRELITRYRAVAATQGLDQLGFYVPPTTYAQLQVIEQSVTATNVVAAIPLEGRTAGSFSIEPQITVPPGLTVVSVTPPRVQVTLSTGTQR